MYANQNTKYTNWSTKYANQNTKYTYQNIKYATKTPSVLSQLKDYAKQNTKSAIPQS